MIALRYSRALLGLAKESHKVAEYQKFLADFIATCVGAPDLIRVLTSKELGFGERSRVLNQVIEKLGGDDTLKRFFAILLQKSRLDLYQEIVLAYDELAHKALGRKVMVLTSAVDLSADVVAKVKKTFEERFAVELIVRAKVDPNVLGGLSVRIEDQIFDGTFRNQLNKLIKAAA